MIDSLLVKLAQLAEIEFADVVIGYDIIEGKLRLYIIDESRYLLNPQKEV